MAPEQARGDRDIDARADVYALGALLFRSWPAGRRSRAQTAEEVLAGILAARRHGWASCSRCRATSRTLVARMLDKNPALRPADGEAALRRARRHRRDHRRAHRERAAPVVGSPTVRITPPSAGRTFTGEGAADAPTPSSARTRGRAPVSSVGVLSFLDMSPARDQDYLCDGIAEELIDTLAQLDGLRVAARSSSFQFKSQAEDARAIGARLGVDAIVEGGVRKAGDHLRITVRLVNVADGYQRWSQRFDGNIEECSPSRTRSQPAWRARCAGC